MVDQMVDLMDGELAMKKAVGKDIVWVEKMDICWVVKMVNQKDIYWVDNLDDVKVELKVGYLESV
jgi:hypothetical protein